MEITKEDFEIIFQSCEIGKRDSNESAYEVVLILVKKVCRRRVWLILLPVQRFGLDPCPDPLIILLVADDMLVIIALPYALDAYGMPSAPTGSKIRTMP